MRRPLPTTVAIYTRVSTEEQAASGLGLADQSARCRAYVDALGIAPEGATVKIYTDAGVSAATLERPALAELLGAIRRREVAAVVVLKLDRLTRRLRDLLDMVESFTAAGVALHSVAERIDLGSAMGRMMVSMLGVFAEWEREQIAERTRAAVRAKRHRGEAHGFAPMGYSVVAGRLAEVAEEVAAIDLMRRRRAEGASLRVIAEELAGAQIPTKRGGAWRACTVDAVLKRVERQEREEKRV